MTAIGVKRTLGQTQMSAAMSGVPYLERESIGLPPCGVVATNDDDDIAQPTARCALYRIKALLQDKTSMITASTATNPRRSTPLGFEVALSRAATEASARACARSESAASEAVTSWAGSARKTSRGELYLTGTSALCGRRV